MGFFDEINNEKIVLPKVNNLKKYLNKNKFNFYQLFSIVLFLIFLFLGIILGNLFSTCKTSSYFYSNSCLVSEFNFSLMILIWFVGLLISITFYAIGHIISLLSNINKNLTKF